LPQSSADVASASLIDGYFLRGTPQRSGLVAQLLAARASAEAARPFYEGFRILGARVPDLSLIALRLVLAGRRADDDAVKNLQAIVERIRKGGAQAQAARSEYRSLLGD
jgi:hypothetical protein